jgi:hypothetical protein
VKNSQLIIPVERIEQAIYLTRGQKIMLDADLALLYGVSVGRLNEAVRRNTQRFPADFMFQLTKDEFEELRTQIERLHLKSQIAISSSGWGGRRHPPHAFTEQGVAMLSTVLRSDRAIRVNIEIMRAFVRMRQILATHADLDRRLSNLEKKYDAQFRVVFDALHQLMAPTAPARKQIGFEVKERPASYGKKAKRSIG